MKKIKPVILGLGNPLFQDEGLGIHVIHRLMEENIADCAELVDGGTDALALLGVVEEAEHLLVIDAVDGNDPAGTIRYLTGQEIPCLLSPKASPHQIGFQEVLALARLRGKLPPQLGFIGVQPQSLNWGTQLTPAIADLMPRLIALVYRQMRVWGV